MCVWVGGGEKLLINNSILDCPLSLLWFIPFYTRDRTRPYLSNFEFTHEPNAHSYFYRIFLAGQNRRDGKKNNYLDIWRTNLSRFRNFKFEKQNRDGLWRRKRERRFIFRRRFKLGRSTFAVSLVFSRVSEEFCMHAFAYVNFFS